MIIFFLQKDLFYYLLGITLIMCLLHHNMLLYVNEVRSFYLAHLPS